MKIFRASFLVILCLLVASCATTSTGPKVTKEERADNHYQLGAAHLKDESFADALVEFTKAVNMMPDNAKYHNGLGLAYGARRMNDEAEKHLLNATRLDPELSEASLNLSSLYLGTRQWDKAVVASKAALKNVFYKTPEFAYNNMGWAYLNKGDYPSALEAFKKSTEVNTRYPMAYNNMGLVYERMDMPEKAESSYKAAIDRAPFFVNPYFNLGLLLKLRGDNEGAIRALNKVVEIESDGYFGLKAREELNNLNAEE